MSQQPAASPKARIAQRIRTQSRRGQFVTVQELTETPYTFTEEAALANLKAMAEEETYQDICWLEGSKGKYLYSSENMSENFARMQVHIVENDTIGMLAEAVRHDSKVYPRPTPLNVFYRAPYSVEKESLEAVLNQIKMIENYRDVQEIKASTGVRYLFSEQHMERAYAQSLVELREVIEDE